MLPETLRRRKEKFLNSGLPLSNGHKPAKSPLPTPTSGKTHSYSENGENHWPRPLLVTHINGTSPRPTGRPSHKFRVLVDHWSIAMNQTVRWSQLENDKNVEIDGVSRLKIHQNKFGFEYHISEF